MHRSSSSQPAALVRRLCLARSGARIARTQVAIVRSGSSSRRRCRYTHPPEHSLASVHRSPSSHAVPVEHRGADAGAGGVTRLSRGAIVAVVAGSARRPGRWCTRFPNRTRRRCTHYRRRSPAAPRHRRDRCCRSRRSCTASPSSQEVPSSSGCGSQAPLDALQVPALQASSRPEQSTGGAHTHTPPEQTSPVVHRSPSSHGSGVHVAVLIVIGREDATRYGITTVRRTGIRIVADERRARTTQTIGARGTESYRHRDRTRFRWQPAEARKSPYRTLHTPTLHPSSSPEQSRVVPAQTPSVHVSDSVQRSPSSQLSPFVPDLHLALPVGRVADADVARVIQPRAIDGSTPRTGRRCRRRPACRRWRRHIPHPR